MDLPKPPVTFQELTPEEQDIARDMAKIYAFSGFYVEQTPEKDAFVVKFEETGEPFIRWPYSMIRG
jgi:hypothetical protein